jgi:hypothetical protein|nr:MAG TPA: hypothetical protein [Caudoviricetes sp.]
MNANDFISDVTANLADWGINYSENTAGLAVGTVALEVSEEESAATITDGDRAAALLTFPLARKAWDAGYTGDFDSEFTVTERPLFRESVDMTDLEAALESTQLAYQNPEEAWQALCGATDFEQDDWSSIVELFHWQARFDYGDRYTKVSTSESENVALVEDCDPESPVRIVDVDAVMETTCWAPSDIAAAVLYTIS